MRDLYVTVYGGINDEEKEQVEANRKERRRRGRLDNLEELGQ